MMMVAFTDAELDAIFDSGDAELQRMVHALITHPYYTFEPLPDDPNDFQESTGFVNSTDRLSIALGGTGSGKTHHAAYKTARYVLETRPFRNDCPFWVIGDSLDVTIEVCWKEKLSQFIPESEILEKHWHDRKRGWPKAVTLRHPDDREKPGWVIEFKSYEQGITGMKAASIGGFWFNEEVPYPIVFEVQGRCREYNSPGWADFTPIECKSPEWPDLYENPPEGWRFYHLNTKRNTHLAEGWADWFLNQVPEDSRDLRQYGVFTVLRGQVFKEFRKAVHVIEPFAIPSDWHKVRALDFGYNNPFCCLWIARDRDGRYFVYDEHFESGKLHDHHAEAIHGRGAFADKHHRSRWKQGPGYGNTYSDHDAQERAELTNRGIICTPANKSLKAGIALLRSMMMIQGDGRPRLYVFANCKNLIRELPGYKWPEGTDTRNPKDDPIDKDNHAIDALRYGVFSEEVGLKGGGVPQPLTIQRPGNRHGVQLHRPGGRRQKVFGT